MVFFQHHALSRQSIAVATWSSYMMKSMFGLSAFADPTGIKAVVAGSNVFSSSSSSIARFYRRYLG
jgi:hypothetical protein